MEEEADVVVLGMGPAGEEVAGRLAGRGLDVVGVEGELLGGECPYWGCVPTKLMVRASDAVAEAGRAARLAGTITSGARWEPVVRRVDDATDGRDDAQAVKRFGHQGGRLRRGRGRLVGPDRVEVDGVLLRARTALVVASGARPVIPEVPGLMETPFWTNPEAVATPRLPRPWWYWAGARSAWSWPGLPPVRLRGHGHRPRHPAARGGGAGGGRSARRGLVEEGIGVRTSSEVSSVYHDGGRFTLLLPGGESIAANGSWWPPGAGRTSGRSAWTPWASTTRRPPSRWTTASG